MTFRSGQSGNPGGRPKGLNHIRDMVQARGDDLIEKLFAIAFGDATEDRTRLEAIKVLLDRGYGRPPQPLDGDGAGGPMQFTFTWLPPEDAANGEDDQ